jgi:hypothetical protein
VKRLIRLFWLMSVAAVVSAAVLVIGRAMGLLSCSWDLCGAPLLIPPMLLCGICFLLGIVDVVNAVARLARRCDRQARWESRPPRYIRRRRRS